MRSLTLLQTILLTICGQQLVWAVESQWVTTGSTGRLIYVPDAEGDRILDFSDVGYRGRGAELVPNTVANAVTLSPVAGDNTTHIQNAINTVSAMTPGPDGYRGAVLLQAGTYNIDSHLEIRASGVVLRGVGRGAGDTVLHGKNPLPIVDPVNDPTPNQRPLIRVYGSGPQTLIGSTRNMIDKVVPAGSRSFRVDSTTGFTVGDTVRINRPSTQAWIDAVGMGPSNPNNWEFPWQPGALDIRYDRVITRIEGDRVFVDAPLANSFDTQFGGGIIKKYTWTGAIENIGIENLRGDTDFTSATDENHAWEFISIGDGQSDDRAQNVWVRNIAAAHFGDSAVVANPSAKWITVDDAISETPISQITGSRRYSFDMSGQLGFLTNSQADEGRHDFVNNSTRPRGPNVFHNSTATNANSDTGPHQKWATGTLFDNVTVQGDAINVRNRGDFGSTHGWSGANMVIWNSSADSFRVQNPPTAQNWLIGSTGTIVDDTTWGTQPTGNYDSHGAAVTAGGETSLYDAQMNDARDIREFHWSGGNGNWTTDDEWNQQVKPDVYDVSLRDYLIGDVDDYTNDGAGSVDDAFVDPAWETFILGSSSHPIVGFDSLSTNQNVAFTAQHQLDPGERVINASLALALKQSGGDLGTDFVRVIDTDPSHRLQFSTLGWDTQINTSDSFVGVLDMGTFLDDLQTGSVNVQVNDDSGVDWALYTATVATPLADPTGPTVFIDSGSASVEASVGPVAELYLGTAGSATLDLAAAGLIDVNGDFTMGANANLAVELEAAQYGTLEVQDAATLAGGLQVSLAAGFNPAAGDAFDVITANSSSGIFSSIVLPALDDGLLWKVDATSGLSLSVLFSADFDENGAVNDNDLNNWQAGFGNLSALHMDGDADGNGLVDGSDFLIWQRQFGLSVSISAVAEIPEPTAGFLALSSVLFMLLFLKIRAA